ncbi:MAG: hypothetical protein F6K36_01895 [Symploca sp. SIO3C6]|uniref:Uncharacterized protein n=1 Tax=Symploca sp. SIO1C4 TaxID=2607765 RepID=A0A6B3NGL2_9CYAN|nr:hypothetical protein [Symploca sp. SIO3C6]NER30837.1 hypothetical protein [Symploca sp. SIO1C4]NET05159.1 hypothetical protein [Symploca sp. SIO2B6]
MSTAQRQAVAMAWVVRSPATGVPDFQTSLNLATPWLIYFFTLLEIKSGYSIKDTIWVSFLRVLSKTDV